MRRILQTAVRFMGTLAIGVMFMPAIAFAEEGDAVTKPSVKSKIGFRQVLEATKKFELAKAKYASDQDSLPALLAAQQAVIEAEIQYLSAMTEVRGNLAMRNYLTREGEVSARQRGLAEVTHLVHAVPDDQKQQVREELKRQEEALKQAKRELAIAEATWKTTDRANQFRYLNRRATIAR